MSYPNDASSLGSSSLGFGSSIQKGRGWARGALMWSRPSNDLACRGPLPFVTRDVIDDNILDNLCLSTPCRTP
ncbi:hypothetical protein CEXT_592931 [Caerostris extrusa]|uniref:Uncharacterized protein n=1 Tax=Caerostris extrusa TaxID=172846 RepID=A0AAV4RF40_CAEEX|nr:hypothetical protein CEXT_592931 [Caerostris extrusa]